MTIATSPTWTNRIVGHDEVAPDQLLANDRNWRRHPAVQQETLSGVLSEVGWVQSVISNQRTGKLIDGHLRVMLAMRNNEPTIPVTYVDLSPDEEALVLATLDPISALATADGEALAALLDDIKTQDENVMKLLEDLRLEHVEFDARTGQTDPDDVPEPPAEPITKPGDLWLLGEHRLLCGDATKAEDVERLMDGERAVLMATDPPYLVGYDGTNHPQTWHEDGTPRQKINKLWDTYREGDESLYSDFLGVALGVALTPEASIYQWHGSRTQRFVEAAWTEHGLLWHQTIIWVKSRAVLGHVHFMRQFEPAAYGWRRGMQHKDKTRFPPNNTSDVWQIGSAANEENTSDDRVDHPTQKPVEIVTRSIEWHTRPGEQLYEPFSGSGTAIIAAEMTGRRCYAMELEPIYCDVAIQRWEQFTGAQASLERREDAA